MGAKSHNFCLFSVYFQHYFKKIVQNPIILPVFSLFCCFFRRFVDGILNVYIDSRYINKFEKYRYRQGHYKNIDIDKEVLENIDIDIDIDKEVLENIDIDNKILENIDIDIDIDKENLENIDIDKDILENIDIDINIDKDILENIDIDIDIDKSILENIDIDKSILENIDIDIDMFILENIDMDKDILGKKIDFFSRFGPFFMLF